MASLTEKARAAYLIILIFFLLAIGFFAFDYFQLIDAADIFPFLRKEPGLVNPDSESPSELEKLEFQKEMEGLAREKDEIQQKEEELRLQKEKLEAELEKIEQLKRGLQAKESELKSAESERNSREKLVKVLADKVANMPPDSAVQMLINWPDKDIIDVFIQMDKDAEQDGRQTITTYLLTLFPAERRATITNKWLSRSDAIRAPESTPESEEL
ncbi:flagellar protein FlbB [Leptospira perolatii]|uniref:Flagellar protein FlbB n=1 Tax=Leptospira perolatii TaxID=2023191 RepID=A0A2M9ZMJ5_9LEPT|nr:flagellar protein FlbB [Leptospira perolatii]PJZ70041.1 flagellar protein FlbB [Leptospira perolatii]PJZ73229.1 flagellar protein FlbB [Leptospira perolatii]